MSDRFEIEAPFEPAGDQPQAIAKLIAGFEAGVAHQTLLGVTGSGKTYTIANVIQAVQKPTLVLAPNKTLAAQLYGEFKSFFPHNAVQLRGQGLVRRQHEGRFLHGLDDVGDGVGLARAGNAQQGLVRNTRLEASDQLGDRLGLVARRLERRLDLKTLAHNLPTPCNRPV